MPSLTDNDALWPKAEKKTAIVYNKGSKHTIKGAV